MFSKTVQLDYTVANQTLLLAVFQQKTCLNTVFSHVYRRNVRKGKKIFKHKAHRKSLRNPDGVKNLATSHTLFLSVPSIQPEEYGERVHQPLSRVHIQRLSCTWRMNHGHQNNCTKSYWGNKIAESKFLHVKKIFRLNTERKSL